MEYNIIEELIVESLKEMSKYNQGKSEGKNTRILLPYYRERTDRNEKKTRYSEQELKQIFLSFIENKSNLYYTVETPSNYLYSFSSFDEPKIEKIESQREHFESARFDTSLYSSFTPDSLLCHVEFKHKNPNEAKEIGKDLLKLSNEMVLDGKNYFVHYIVRGNNWKSKTFPSVMSKYYESVLIKENEQKNLGNVIVFLMFYDASNGERTILKFDLKSFKEKYESEIKEKDFDEKCFNWMVVSE